MALRRLTDSTTAIPRWRLTRWRATANDVRILDGVDEYLFMGSELRLALEAQAQKMREAVETEPEENLKQADPVEWAAALAHHFAVACPELKTEDVWMEEPRPVKIDVSRDPGRYFGDPYSDLARNYPGERIVVHVPFKGDAGVFKLRPSSFTTVWPRGQVKKGRAATDDRLSAGSGAERRWPNPGVHQARGPVSRVVTPADRVVQPHTRAGRTAGNRCAPATC